MYLNKIIPIIFVSIIIFNCAGTNRNHFDLSTPDDCNPLIKEDLLISEQKPIDSLIIKKQIGGQCLTQHGAFLLAKKTACKENYKMATMIDIVKPHFMFGPCYQTKILFYKDSSKYTISEKPILSNQGQSLNGISLGAFFMGSQVISGLQSETGLVSEKGDEASTSKIEFGINPMYYLNNYLAIGPEFWYGFSDANAPETKSMSFSNQFSLGGFLDLIVWNKLTARGFHMLHLEAELYHTWFSLSNDYIEFVEENQSITLIRDRGPGIGYGAGAGYRLRLANNLYWEFSIKYQTELPKFRDALKAMDGTMIGLKFGFGYHFKTN